MPAQTDAMIYVYDVDGEGACVMHFANAKPEGVYVSLGQSVMHPQFFVSQQAMHKSMGHTLTMEADNHFGVLWTVRIGRGDFQQMLEAIGMALAGVMPGDFKGGFDASQN